MLTQIHDVVRPRGPAAIPICPGCHSPMVFKSKKPILFTDGLADAIYRCEARDVETKRTVRYLWKRTGELPFGERAGEPGR